MPTASKGLREPLLLDFLRPDGISFVVKSHTEVAVVGVDAACLAIDVPFGIALAAAAHVLTVSAYPFSCRANHREYTESSVVEYGHHLYAMVLGNPFGISSAAVDFDVLPSFHCAFLTSPCHPFAPLLAFVVGCSAFEESPVGWVVLWSFWWDV